MEPEAFKLGVQAARAGDFQTASTYFMQVVQANPNSEKGWLYLGRCLADRGKRITCYQRVLKINPDNQEAQQALSDLGQFYYSPGGLGQESYTPPPEPVYPVAESPRPTSVPRKAKPKKSSSLSNTLLIVAGGLVVCVALVCGGLWLLTKLPGSQEQTTLLTPTSIVENLPTLNAAALPAPASPAGVGQACLGYWRDAITCLDESGWHTYTTENSDLPDAGLEAGAFCPDGRLAIAHALGFSLFDGQQWEHLPELPEGYGMGRALACAPNGQLWTAHYKGISRYVNGGWQTFGVNQLASGELTDQHVKQVITTPDGKIWALTKKSVAMFANEAWTIFEKGQGLLDAPTALTMDTTGRPWIWHYNGAAVYENGQWRSFQTNEPVFAELIGLDARGWLWLGYSETGVRMFDGQAWSQHNQESHSLSSTRVAALVADSLGRVWVATSYGLSIFDGAQWQTYRMDNADLADNRIAFVVVERDGPTLLPPIDKNRGSLTGTLPLKYKRVELCNIYADTFPADSTPCAAAPFHMSTSSDGQGVFLFKNVPPGYYYLLAETNSGWAKLVGEFGFFAERVLVEPGQEFELGRLVLTNH